MSFVECIDISSDEEIEVREVKDVKPIISSSVIHKKASYNTSNKQPDRERYLIKQEHGNHNLMNGLPYGSYTTDRGSIPADGLCLPSTSIGSSVPVCRQFWKSGDYEVRQSLGPVSQNGKNRLRIHPKFLHSNATSHKWAFGAIAELLDNAIDEVQNGATFVSVDKFSNPRNGDAALLIQDDGGGMDPESLRRCMSFGFSDKQSNACIGQYGNGFKTSTMRLGADVIVFSRSATKRVLTQSVGLLSYTFLRQTGCNDIVVPVVDYECNQSTGEFAKLLRSNEKQFSSNLSTLLRWSPFTSEVELLKQFNDIGHHGTKVIVFNLWYNDDGDMELDFESDKKDILINKRQKVQKLSSENSLTQKHVAKRLHYSLRVYSSVLYLHIPGSFKIVLRGEVVVPYHIVNGLIYRECIMYRPQVEGNPEVVTTVGFVEGAPNVTVHGFNVYHKNRLILPFWVVATNSYGKGRGVVGVLEANFIKPTHDKQDFEKSAVFQKLEIRLKEMTYEYWDLHCHLLGYKSKLNPRPNTDPNPLSPPALRTYRNPRKTTINQDVSGGTPVFGNSQAQVVTALGVPNYNSDTGQTGLSNKRKHESHISATDSSRKQRAIVLGSAAGFGGDNKTQLEHCGGQKRKLEIKTMIIENKKLREQCIELEETEKELLLKEEKLRRELLEFQLVYDQQLIDLESLNVVKLEEL